MRKITTGFSILKKHKQHEDAPLKSITYHDLMPFKVREILMVSSLYDAFIIEEEGLISELVTDQYQHLLLTSPPRVTRVHSGEEALLKLQNQSYDLVITMSKNIGMDPYKFGEKIKMKHPNIPVVLLMTDIADLSFIRGRKKEVKIDEIFYWTGDPILFLVIIKYIEDKINAPFDTKNGNVQVLIMMEDSIRYYSMFLPIIYTELVQQTRRSLSEDLNEMQRRLRRRARTKILLAKTYEEGINLYTKYKKYVLGIITDVEFKHYGEKDSNAGFDFIHNVRQDSKYLRILIQSSNPENRVKAEKINAFFLDKNSSALVLDFEHFLLKHLGFGDFIFRHPINDKRRDNLKLGKIEEIHIKTKEIARAANMKEFEKILQKIPLESIQFHSDRNDFSNWLMARGEFKLAMKLRPKKSSDFTDLDEVRRYIINMFNESRRQRQLDVITDFSKQKFEFDSSFTRIRGDSLGGKGRGIAFIRSLLTRYEIGRKYPDIKITIPNTVVIGSLEFDRFIIENKIRENINGEYPNDYKIAERFLNGKICNELENDLKKILTYFKTPIAVRSSSLLEDSKSWPFAGIYKTYMLPNNHKDKNIRLNQLCQAIKLIYASVFFKESRAYIKSTSSKIEEEKMSVVIQELVGNDYDGNFYPTFSGVAQSYNFYPVGHQKSEEGIASIAIGLGKTVVGGERSLRFSPRYPQNIPEFSSLELILENSQKELYVLDTSKREFKLSEKEDVTLRKINVNDIKNDGTLDNIASSYNVNDGIIRDNLSEDSPVIITFNGILKYEIFPLSSLLQDILEIGQKGMGCPIQIEFAVDLKKDQSPIFAILQIRPLAPSYEYSDVTWDEKIDEDKILINSNMALGNGVIKTIKDIVYVIPNKFDNTKTIEIAEEIGKINDKLSKPFILIGPGRWGSEDRFLGIPVKWNQISDVKMMVETALKNFNIKPSQGTHFFHNITSRGIGYINIPYNSKKEFIDWIWLENQTPKEQLNYVKHIEFSNPLTVKLNGRKGNALVLKP